MSEHVTYIIRARPMRSIEGLSEEVIESYIEDGYLVSGNTVWNVDEENSFMSGADDIAKIFLNEDGSYTFVLSFYNGGACKEEMGDSAIKDFLDKNPNGLYHESDELEYLRWVYESLVHTPFDMTIREINESYERATGKRVPDEYV